MSVLDAKELRVKYVTIPKKAVCPRGNPELIFAWDMLAVVGSAKKSMSHGNLRLNNFLGTC
jgi:hypothetical protein